VVWVINSLYEGPAQPGPIGVSADSDFKLDAAEEETVILLAYIHLVVILIDA
jgi:hypothetical protein